jgi:hypothetical protein
MLLLAACASTPAQIVVEVTQDQEQFLPGEAMPVAVRVINRSGQVLHLGGEPDWLTFSIETRDGRGVAKVADVPVIGEFDLESSQVGVKRLDLAPYFSLGQEGRYAVIATVRVRGWDREINSKPKPFSIIEGAKLWEQEVGAPNASGDTNAPPQVRKYILQQANYLRGRLRLYLRVLDEYGKAIKVVPVGPMVSFGRPEPPQIDRACNLHVLYQNGPTSFSYTVWNPNGELVARQVHDYINSRPKLRVDALGQISVAGGNRRLTDNDFPPSGPDDTVEETSTNTPPSTANTAKAAPPPEKSKGAAP